MNYFTTIAMTGLFALTAEGQIPFSNVVKASVIFRDDFDATRRYPHILKVFLSLENTHDSSVSWVANPYMGIEAEILDEDGKPLQKPPQSISIPSNPYALLLPFGSRLEWLVSHQGIAMMADAQEKYALMVGGRGWLVPIETAHKYTLRIRLQGIPWIDSTEYADFRGSKLLLDLAPTAITITK